MGALHDVVRAGKARYIGASSATVGGTPPARAPTRSPTASTTSRRTPTSSTRWGEVAAARGVPPAQVALAWLLSRPGVTAPIVGSTKKRHLKDALAAEELTLTGDEIASLEKPYVPHPVLGHF